MKNYINKKFFITVLIIICILSFTLYKLSKNYNNISIPKNELIHSNSQSSTSNSALLNKDDMTSSINFFNQNTERRKEIRQKWQNHEWVEVENTNIAENSKENLVFITNTGNKYHRSNCPYLKSKTSISKEKAIEKGYAACSKCNP